MKDFKATCYDFLLSTGNLPTKQFAALLRVV